MALDSFSVAFHTTKESRSEAQPHITPSVWSSPGTAAWTTVPSSSVIERLRTTRDRPMFPSSRELTKRWGTDCFAKLLGDWALSIWNPKDRSLILAKDLHRDAPSLLFSRQ